MELYVKVTATLSDIFVRNAVYKSSYLRTYLLKEAMIGRQCSRVTTTVTAACTNVGNYYIQEMRDPIMPRTHNTVV